MTRPGIIAAHLAALPVALLLSVALAVAVPSLQAVDIHLNDTFFVVAHFHATILLGVSALVVTLVASRYGSINPLIVASWAFVITHVASAALPWLRRGSIDPGPGVVTTLPSHPGLGYLYIASALMGLLTVMLGMVVSLLKVLRQKG